VTAGLSRRTLPGARESSGPSSNRIGPRSAGRYGRASSSASSTRPTGGRCFEDFRVGQVLEHELGRTITATDNSWFTLLTMNTNPMHFDAEYAKASVFGRPLVNSCFTLALVTGLSVADLSQNAVANLGWEQVKLPAPVFEGDTIRARSEITGVRASKSRPTAGIVRFKTTGYNQYSEPVIEFARTILVYRRANLPQRAQTAART
jgi:itaconyl-CoA hydratase